jgi:ATP-dependent HslUV protease ATP-binding subunit HslU
MSNTTKAILVGDDDHDGERGHLELVPAEIVRRLDEYIIGQQEAKKKVAIAVRNRWRRQQLSDELSREVQPKNMIMIGPTGVGKTEIARRLSDLVNAPFLKVEASKFTEVGYQGRDVESMVRNLVDIGVNMVREEAREEVQSEARDYAIERLLDRLVPEPPSEFPDEETREEQRQRRERNRERMREKLEAGKLDDRRVEIEVQQQSTGMMQVFSDAGMEEYGMNLQDMMGNMMPDQTKTKNMRVPDALDELTQQEAEKLIDDEDVTSRGVERATQAGIIFIDEMDKIAEDRESQGSSPDVAREGVQRDMLPIIEGTTVNTRHGPVKTDHILFIASGAFHVSSPSDLIPELQGRFPLRTELHALDESDFVEILTRPKDALIKQYRGLIGTEGVELEFTEGSIEEMAHIAAQINENTQNIGARRLHTIIENVVEEISFEADQHRGETFVVDQDYVQETLEDVMEDEDLAKYIL